MTGATALWPVSAEEQVDDVPGLPKLRGFRSFSIGINPGLYFSIAK
jgi:hypothetical protein